MTEATCTACGNTERIAEPADADFVTCARCGARIDLPGMEDLPTRIGARPFDTDDPDDVADLPAPKRPSARSAIAAPEIADLPAPKTSRTTPHPGSAVEPISDLPAPKRKSMPAMRTVSGPQDPAAPGPRNPPAPGTAQRNPPAPRPAAGEIEELPPDKPGKPDPKR